jgi:hypothetical protein
MSSDLPGATGRHQLAAASPIGLATSAPGQVAAANQDEGQDPRSRRGVRARLTTPDGEPTPRSRRISEEVVVGSSIARSPDYNEDKKHSIIQVIEHVFKEDENPDAGYPVTRAKEFPIKPATKLAIVTISGFEFWFGTAQQEIMAASSRYGLHTGLEADFAHATLTVKVRANYRFWGKVDRDWAWRCRVVIQCFGET